MEDILWLALLIPALVLCTSFWVFVDAAKIGVKRGQLRGLKNMGPGGWLISCLFLWIFAFPYYLSVRDELKRAQPKCPECGGVVVEGARKCLHCGSPIEELFNIRCPACGAPGQIRASALNEEIRCQRCKKVFPASTADRVF
jgi:DNA-directed RNA polymerase subunit RPC12/RpoP